MTSTGPHSATPHSSRSPSSANGATDALTFEQYARRYNFENTANRSRIFTNLIVQECERAPKPVSVLDIGCGKGIELMKDLQLEIREHATEYWGVEPDAGIEPTAGLFDRWITALIEGATLPENHFDVAYSFMVMEHAADPEAFMQAVLRCLKPGGAYIFATPNRRHYFTRIASTLNRLGMDEFVLRKSVGSAKVDEYHYPTKYLFNDERRVNAVAAALGCPPPEYVYLEPQGPIGYFPKPTRFIYHALRMKRKIIRRKSSLVTMVGRIRKSSP